MYKLFRHFLRYIEYIIHAKTKHGIHSPFVFEFITKVLEDKTHYTSYHKVEELRKRLLSNRNMIEIVDFGASAGKKGYSTHLERVQKIAAKSSISSKDGQLLHKIVKYFKPEIMLELGTAFGISSIYQVTASPDSFFIGIEGCATTAAFAEQNLGRVTDSHNYSIVIGNFDRSLPGVLQKLDKVDYVFIDGNHAYKPTLNYVNQLLPYVYEGTIIILHDIHWSNEMEKAWTEIISNKAISVSIDLFSMGILFFIKGIPKQHFIIRY